MDSSKSFFNRRTSAKRKWQCCFLSRGLCDLEDKRRSENIAFQFIVKSLPGYREARRIISIILWQSTLLVEEEHFLHFSYDNADSNIRRWRKEYICNKKWRRRHLNEKTEKRVWKRWRFSSPEKCVPDHDDRFIHRCQVRLCEDNQLYMLPSICLLTTKKILFFLHSLMLDSREKERERRIVLLRFGFNGEERKKNVFCIILSKRRT